MTAAIAPAALVPAVASAAAPETFCVHETTSCPPGSVDEQSDLQQALTDAAAHSATTAAPNEVDVGPGTYTPTGNSGFSYSSANPLRLVGASESQTTLTTTGAAPAVLALGSDQSGNEVSVSQLSIAASTGGGLGLTGGTADHVSVTATGQALGVLLKGSRMTNCTVSDAAQNGFGISVEGGSDEIDDSTVTAAWAAVTADSSTTPTVLHRVRLTGAIGLEAIATPVAIDDSLVLASGTGLYASDDPNEGSINALNVTVLAHGASTVSPTEGVDAFSDGNGGAEVQIDNSIVRGFQDAFYTSADTAAIIASTDNYDGATSGQHVSIGDPIAGDPLFVNAAGGDYHLAWSSPLVDASSITNVGAGSSTTDLDGNPRVVTFTHSSTPVDLGAFEYQHRAPVAVAKVSPSGGAPGASVSFDGSASYDPDPGDTLSYAWSFDDGTRASGATVTHSFATPGQHSGTLTVTDPTGLSASQTAAVAITVPSLPQAPLGKLFAHSPTVSGDTVTLQLACNGPGSCPSAKLVETTVAHLLGQKLLSVSAASAHKRKTAVVVASRGIQLAAGKTTTVKLTLNAAGRKLLAKFHKLPVTLTVSYLNAGKRITAKTVRVTLRPAKKEHGHH